MIVEKEVFDALFKKNYILTIRGVRKQIGKIYVVKEKGGKRTTKVKCTSWFSNSPSFVSTFKLDTTKN